jgi:multidrug efflux pump subunit AcrA (membrane-fusion protein)
MAATQMGKTGSLRFINAALLVLAASLIVGGACNYAPEAPAVEKATVWTDTVKRGDMAIERRGAGQLFETESGELAVQVRVPESQSLDLEIGQTAVVDLRVDTAPARVSGLDDRIVQGTRLVYLEFTEGRPEKALPGMSIDAAIQIDVIADVLYVGKPAYGRSNSQVGLFRITDDSGYAERVIVQLGRTSVDIIEITAGLEEGDQIILSDMSRWDSVDRVAMR